MKEVIVCAEASAVHLKNAIVDFLAKEGYEFVDATSRDDLTYIEAGSIIGESISKGEYSFGIVMCGTGMAYADLKEFRKEDLIESNGVWYIQKRRIKTGSEYISVVMPWAKEIIDRYEKLPVISNQKINTYLHCIEDQMKLPIKLHCHLARHSYATFLLNKGVKLETVSKTLGHKNTKITTQFYVKFLPDTITKEVASIIK
jgi:integrase